MSDHSDILAQSVDRLFADIAASRPSPDEAWRSIEELGIPALFLPETEGGMEGSWSDAEIVFQLSGYHAIELPVGETMIARKLLSEAGIKAPTGPLTLGRGQGDIDAASFSGTIRSLSSSLAGCQMVACVTQSTTGACVLIDPSLASHGEERLNLAGEPRTAFTFENARCDVIVSESGLGDTIMHAGALLRAAQIGGALARSLEQCVNYAQERSQFGRELRKFQAIQHQIALLAEEAAAVACASSSAAAARDSGDAEFEIACAKLRANQATGKSALIAHQVHGAIGITEEHDLHRFTQRLWAWRSEFGNDRYWAKMLGNFMLSFNGRSPWDTIVSRGES
ncbi:hypothetical protein MB02_03105 [Croceicoccus estronivorus]|uniref:acyl-CoA dehydrogenase family protein n=1 Tax=Croceicoccus estronivorus TaxID=1172626 RepID=UPI000835B372|nr:acyl-CoA dehydrogenase family protein [Croceicoccus estronivorus]OCC25628.1 hypothetical protein MB02_03105 [Croceicoccus estronivorus]